jgi:hypothetical protein
MNVTVKSMSGIGQRGSTPYFLVGRNSRGQWVVRERQARRGGLFNSRAEALHFAFRELGEAAGAVILVPDVLDLFEADSEATSAGRSIEVGEVRKRVTQEA